MKIKTLTWVGLGLWVTCISNIRVNCISYAQQQISYHMQVKTSYYLHTKKKNFHETGLNLSFAAVMVMDRDYLIGFYCELRISHRYILKSFAVLHGIILSERNLQRFMRKTTGSRTNN